MIAFTFSWSLVVYTAMTLFIGFAVGVAFGIITQQESKKVTR